MRSYLLVFIVSICCIVNCLGCNKETEVTAPVVEPKGKLVWHSDNRGTFIIDLSGNYSGEREYFAGSIQGNIVWEFLPRTEMFGSIILVRVELPGTIVSNYLLRDGEFKILYEDTKNKIEYINK